MREQTKTAIHGEIKKLQVAIKDKRDELNGCKNSEEDMPENINEALDEIINGDRNHKVSEETKKRLAELKLLEQGFDIKFEEYIAKMTSKETNEQELLIEVEKYCVDKINCVKEI